MMRSVWLILILCFLAGSAWGEDFSLDAAPRNLSLGETFTQATLTVFGGSSKPGDFVIVFEGPSASYILNEKTHAGLLWLNGKSIRIKNAPSFYAVSSSKPLAEMMDEATRARLRLAMDDLVPALSGQENREFALGFLRLKLKNQHYIFNQSGVEKLLNNEFRSDIFIPSSVPVGAYTIRAYLFRGGKLISSTEKPYDIRKTGMSLALSDFIEQHHILSSLAAIAVMLIIGLVGSFLLPRR